MIGSAQSGLPHPASVPSGQPQSQTMTLAWGFPARTPAAMVRLTSAMTSGPDRFEQRGQRRRSAVTVAVRKVLRGGDGEDAAQARHLPENVGQRIREPLADLGSGSAQGRNGRLPERP